MASSESYYILISSDMIQFPKLCPVCGSPTCDEGSIAKSSGIPSSSRLEDWYMRGHKKFAQRLLEIKRLQVPVCEEHYYSPEHIGKIRGMSAIVGGLSILTFLYTGFMIWFRIFLALPIGSFWLVLLPISLGVLFLSLRNLGPSTLQKSIDIVYSDKNSEEVVLRIQHKWYRDELLRLNPMRATPVRPIFREEK